MELSIYSLFKVDIKSLVQSKAILCKNFNIQPSEVDRMPYWEWEMYRKYCEEIAEEEKKQQEEQENKYGTPSSRQYHQQSQRMMRGYNNGSMRMPSMPSIPKMPKI